MAKLAGSRGMDRFFKRECDHGTESVYYLDFLISVSGKIQTPGDADTRRHRRLRLTPFSLPPPTAVCPPAALSSQFRNIQASRSPNLQTP